MNSILQGTTPSLKLSIDKTDLDLSDVIGVELTFSHKNVKTIHTMEDVVVDTTENSITYAFSEQETLALSPSHVFVYQLRLKTSDGNIVGTEKENISISNLLSTEVMA